MTPRFTALVVLLLVACRRSPDGGRSVEDSAGTDLVGVWDATVELGQSYPLELDAPSARGVCGTFGFVENHRRVQGSAGSEIPLQVGVYDLALKRIGLEWSGTGAFPLAVASHGLDRDSVRILLNPGSDERIVFLGKYDARGINGEWTAQSARGTARGVFSLRPHVVRRRGSPGGMGSQLSLPASCR